MSCLTCRQHTRRMRYPELARGTGGWKEGGRDVYTDVHAREGDDMRFSHHDQPRWLSGLSPCAGRSSLAGAGERVAAVPARRVRPTSRTPATPPTVPSCNHARTAPGTSGGAPGWPPYPPAAPSSGTGRAGCSPTELAARWPMRRCRRRGGGRRCEACRVRTPRGSMRRTSMRGGPAAGAWCLVLGAAVALCWSRESPLEVRE